MCCGGPACGPACGPAVALLVGREVHPSVPQAPEPSQATQAPGIDHLGVAEAADEEATVGQIPYRSVCFDTQADVFSEADEEGMG